MARIPWPLRSGAGLRWMTEKQRSESNIRQPRTPEISPIAGISRVIGEFSGVGRRHGDRKSGRMRTLERMKTYLVTTTPDASLREAADLMDLYQSSVLPVVDA